MFDPLHYLALLERKIGALDQAAPLADWELPEASREVLRRLLEARMGKQGKREFVQVFGLMEIVRVSTRSWPPVRDAIARGVIGFDAVKHLVLCRDRAAAAAARHGDVSLPALCQRGDHFGPDIPGSAPRRPCRRPTRLTVLLAHHLKALKLPTFLREYDKLARQCATDAVDHVRYLLRLAELELIERERRTVERRIKEAKFPAVESLDSFDFRSLCRR